ncbi:FAD-dependent oxidoreductase [Kineosporia sp. NBRC 101677]|uniref:FAD-dependent oxidoreductase n=1 Tax=Kineosporia sp. NBRC 101677 TaxID=3032197 RepID=UPI0024A5600B|nr:NAD(P)/FAD-dependent oxidoreductase [Kineosporia sp. NBRC 101677]GLY14301.1 FAD-dependent oxidoreductase [Kineosporia sp. NBRC 101677]
MTKTAMIIGGGIAGTVTAIALHEAGLRSVVHEAYGAGSDGIGAFLTIQDNGLAALAPLGLHRVVGDLGMPTKRMHLGSGRTGKDLGSTGMRARTLSRSDLYLTLRSEAERRGIEICYGKRLVDASRTDSGVRAAFGDGTFSEGDLLIGADGLRSRTRALLDPGAPSARFVGLLNTGGYAPDLKLGGAVGDAHFIFGKRCFFAWLTAPDGGTWWFANPPAKSDPGRDGLDRISPEAWRQQLKDLFAGDRSPALAAIDATDELFPPWTTYDFPRVPVWHDDRMVIIGDAAHATAPSAGQGASMAIEDAVVLARCLRDLPSTEDAFVAYEQIRRSRVEKVVAAGRRNGSGKAAGPVGAVVRDAMMPYVVKHWASEKALAWMTEYRIDWAEPVRR